MSAEAQAGGQSLRRTLVVEEILETAVEIFADRGFQGTGIQDIADAMHMSRPAIYHYFGSKDELLAALAKGMAVEHGEFIGELREDTTLGHAEKLRRLIVRLAQQTAAKPAHMRLLAADEHNLPPKIAAAHAEARRSALQGAERIIEDGVAAGELRPVNARIAALAIFGMCNWIAWWYDPDGDASPEDIAEEMQRLALVGLLRPQSRQGPGQVEQAIALLREDLDFLERVLPPNSA